MPAEVLMEKVANLDEVVEEFAKIKDVVTEAVEDGVRSAVRMVKQGRVAAEDAIDDARHAMRKNPLQAIAITFVAGAVTGGLAVWIAMRKR